MYIVRSAHNPKLILCNDGQFYSESLCGIGGWRIKTYKTQRGAAKSCHDKPVIVEEVASVSHFNA
jgi:hypothetical protein